MYKPLLFQCVRLVLIIISIALLCFSMTISFSYLYPLAIAGLIAIILHPVVTFLEERLKLPRLLGTTGTMLVLFFLLSGILFILVSEFIQGTLFLAEQLPTHFQTFSLYLTNFIEQNIIPIYQKLTAYFQTLNASQQAAISENLKHFINNLTASATTFLQGALLKLPTIIASLPSSITIVIFILLAAFMITVDYKKIVLFFHKHIPNTFKMPIHKVIVQLKKTIIGYAKAQIILVLISAILVYIGLVIIQVNHAFTITLYIALVDLFPYIGSGIIFMPWIIYLFIVGNYSMSINLSILYGIVIIIRQLIEPKILSSSIGIHPLVALITLFIGIQFWGVIGFLIAPIMLIFINTLYRAGTFNEIWKFIKG